MNLFLASKHAKDRMGTRTAICVLKLCTCVRNGARMCAMKSAAPGEWERSYRNSVDACCRRRLASEKTNRRQCCDLGRSVTYRMSFVSLDCYITHDVQIDVVAKLSVHELNAAQWRMLL